MAGSNYSVNITLNTGAAKTSLQKLEKRIDKLRRNLNEPLKIDTRVSKIQKEIAKSKDAQKASMIETRRLGDLVQRQADKGLKVDKARAAIKKAGLLDQKGQLKAAEAQRKIAANELKIQQDITESIAERQRLIASGKFAGGKNFGQIGGSIGPALPPSGLGTTGGGKFGLQSAFISGAFPLLFGQGPLVGAAGFLGGGLGEKYGGQMGGFAGGLVSTAAATALQQFASETAKLGQALNDTTKNVQAVTDALGVVGTEFSKQIKTLEELGGEEEAFEAARQRMIRLVGQDGVDALTNFGKNTTELANQFTIAMTRMRAGMANFLENTQIGKFLLDRMTLTNLFRQAQYTENKDERMDELFKLYRILQRPAFGHSAEDKLLKEQYPELTSANLVEQEIANYQTQLNQEAERLEIQKLMEAVQEKRIENIDDEIALLEKSFGLSSAEFKIEQQIAALKKDTELHDENEVRSKLETLEVLKEQRRVTEEIEASFKKLAQTVSTDVSEGIKGLIRGTSTLNDLLLSVTNRLIDAAFNMAFFGSASGNLNKGMGLFGNLFGGFLHEGGSAKAGNSYIVGEKGPELFTPGVSGTVTPNNQLGGSTSVVVNVDASGTSVEGDQPNAEELGRLIGAVVQSELIKEKRPGGLLS